jgi:hypothetical protein
VSTDERDEHEQLVDETLLDEMLACTPRERLLNNDQLLRTVEKLEQGFAVLRADRDPR